MSPRTRPLALRALLVGVAAMHLFPIVRHAPLFLAARSLGEAWKALGPIVAIGVLLVAPPTLMRAATRGWRRHRVAFVATTCALAVAHAVPALDHVPRFLATPCWGDAWRGFGASIAAVWFAIPAATQALLTVGLVRAARDGAYARA